MSLEIVLSWPDFVLVPAGSSSASVIKLGSLLRQHTVAALHMSCQVVRRSKSDMVTAIGQVAFVGPSVRKHVLSAEH